MREDYLEAPAGFRRMVEQPWHVWAETRATKVWQALHRHACDAGGPAWVCGDNFAYFRNVDDRRTIVDYRVIFGGRVPARGVGAVAPGGLSRCVRWAPRRA